jgi:hypothetical protein
MSEHPDRIGQDDELERERRETTDLGYRDTKEERAYEQAAENEANDDEGTAHEGTARE